MERHKVSRLRNDVVDGQKWLSKGCHSFATSRGLNATSCISSSSWIQRLMPSCQFFAQDTERFGIGCRDGKYMYRDYKPAPVYENSRRSKYAFHGGSHELLPGATGAMNAVLESRLAPPLEFAVCVLPKPLPTMPSLLSGYSKKMDRRRALKEMGSVCSTSAGCTRFSNEVRQTVYLSDERRPTVSCKLIAGLIPDTSCSAPARVTGVWRNNPAIVSLAKKSQDFNSLIMPAGHGCNGPASASMDNCRDDVNLPETMVMGDSVGGGSRHPSSSKDDLVFKENLTERRTEQFSFHPFHRECLCQERLDTEQHGRVIVGERRHLNVMESKIADNHQYYKADNSGKSDCHVAYKHLYSRIVMHNGGNCPRIEGGHLAQSENEMVEKHQGDSSMQKARAPSCVDREASFSAGMLPSCHFDGGDMSSKLGIHKPVK